MMSRDMAQITSKLDSIFCVYKEKIADSGEDSYCYQLGEHGLLLGAFDGCGGSGARQYVQYRNHTGAYMASRAVSGAVQWLFENGVLTKSAEDNAKIIHDAITKSLTVCKENSGTQNSSKLKGSMAKEFPTTVSIVHCTVLPGGIMVDCYWAGDSRVYLLDEDGLAQITVDDLDGLDAYENISGDGVLTNVVSASKPFQIHVCRVQLTKPFMVFAATDGCFGYIPTPMEFEAFLLENLCTAGSMAEFEVRLTNRLEKIAGDDYTFVGAAFGYNTFPALKNAFAHRANYVNERYKKPLKSAPAEKALTFWKEYQRNYYRYQYGR